MNVLFLCTGNSARSILAEAYLNSAGQGRFTAHSAGSHPAGKVNPFALELLEKNRLPRAGLRSKNWDEFARAGAPKLDFVFTVCDNAAGDALVPSRRPDARGTRAKPPGRPLRHLLSRLRRDERAGRIPNR